MHVGDLQEHLLRHGPTLVHFSGHGSAESEIILEDDSNLSYPVPVGILSGLFSVLRRSVRCVVLNSCYSEPQARVIAEQIACVIGMSKTISDEAAINFAAFFYHALGYGESIWDAFSLGRLSIDSKGLGEGETPKLLCPYADPKKVFLVSEERSAGTPEQMIELARSLIEGGAHERIIAAQILFVSPRAPLASLIIDRSAADPHPMARYWLNRALGKLNTPAALAALRRNLDDPDPYAALGAEDAL